MSSFLGSDSSTTASSLSLPPITAPPQTSGDTPSLPHPPSKPQSPRKSYLPAWLLASKELSANVRRNSLECQVRLKSLKTTVQTFNDVIDAAKKADEASKRPKTPPPPPPPIHIDDELGGDVASLVLQFCELRDWLTFSMTCTKMMRFVLQERADLWDSYYERHFLDSWDDVDSIMVEERGRNPNEKDRSDGDVDNDSGERNDYGDEDSEGSSNLSSSNSTPAPISPPPEPAVGSININPSRASLHLAHQINCNAK
eukprot:CAMPEP_0197569950 /NCGR_PEP_ID=MMETSP1320-20131121/39873_1 /TAXON_ID=91990 /ORGANISM="Bolidomonas sp., Strain RCC2347" /LENGTH=255 /DNA_ID=CAMNT_0043132357 /DNA_START=52 /DNA_END=816 /DNA_ORIENTATION=+